jgi:hypothetical protein
MLRGCGEGDSFIRCITPCLSCAYKNIKLKAKLSLCLHKQHTMSGGIDPRILDLGAGLGWVVICKTGLEYWYRVVNVRGQISVVCSSVSVVTTGICFSAGTRSYTSPHHRVQICSGAHSASYPMGTLLLKRPKSQADHQPPSSSEVKNAWSYTSTSPYIYMAWFLIKQGIRLHGVELNLSKGTALLLPYNRVLRDLNRFPFNTVTLR